MWEQTSRQETTYQRMPRPGSVPERPPVDGEDSDALTIAAEDGEQGALDGMHPATWHRLQARRLIREFLRAVPRAEPEATLTLVQADGTTRLLTRAQLATAIDRLRPRQRQIMRLALEERWPRQKVCQYLHGISIKTFERDQVEALDMLAQL